MECIIPACMVICVLVLFRVGPGFSSALLWVLSADIVISFVVLMICGGSTAAVVLFVANLLVSPWVAFLRAKEGLSPNSEENSNEGVAANVSKR